MIGATMNAFTSKYNNNKMPVLTNYHFEDNTHFSYQDKSKVKLWIFSDIIPIGEYMYSIGDILLYLGMMVNVTLIIYFTYKYITL